MSVDVEKISEEITDQIEERLGRSVGSRFEISQEQAVEILRDVESWARDRGREIQSEIDDLDEILDDE